MVAGRGGLLLAKGAKVVLRDVALFVGIAVAVGLLLRVTGLVDKYFIFFPERDLVQTPGDRGLEFEDVFFDTADGRRLHGWFVPGRTETTIVWFHGNAGNISHRVDNMAELHSHLGHGVFIFDYRGYGRSDGSPSEEGTYLDAEAALAYVEARSELASGRTVLFGRSLGCAVAVEMAARHSTDAVILESAFTSIQAMAKKHYPYIPGIGLLARTKYDALSRVGDVKAPVMVIHGDQDEIAPLEMGLELFEAANEPKRFHRITGAHHNDTYAVGGRLYYEAMASFMADSLSDTD